MTVRGRAYSTADVAHLPRVMQAAKLLITCAKATAASCTALANAATTIPVPATWLPLYPT